MNASSIKRTALLLTATFVFSLVFVVLTVVTGAYQQANASITSCVTGPGKLPSVVPQPLNSIFTAAAEQYDVPPYVVALLYFGENGGYREPPPPYGDGAPYASSPKAAQGPFQFIPGTWSTYKNSNPSHTPGNVQDLTDAAFGAAHYAQAELGAMKAMPFGELSSFTKKGTGLRVFANYNAGPYANGYSNPETLSYVERIYEEYRAHYTLLSTKSQLSPTFASNGCGNVLEIPTTSASGGFPNTSSLPCYAGKDAGIAKTAQGNVIRLCDVSGFVVNTSISVRVDNLVRYVARDGVTLRGSAFRDAGEQIALRKQNCGISHYAIYEMPSSQCSPSTAIPGTSRHEQGKALDISGVGGYGTRDFRTIGKYAIRPDVSLFNTVSGEYWHWDIGNE